ncbi:MAG TPA: UDP-3-O-acyl-N-acetylglucosamine deacetylase [Nitrospinota bacterium]|nr:UDP-3-O-acyl-N-acetylglucosamine deacetylase [Nitrospinota bacterium]
MKKENILIVDDEKNIIKSLEAILLDEGYSVNKADNGLKALELLETVRPELVLLDIWIPGKDGIEVLKEIKSKYPLIEVIVISGHGSIETSVKAIKLGAFDFIEKPFSLEKMIITVSGAIKKQTNSRKNKKAKKTDRRAKTNKNIESKINFLKELNSSLSHEKKLTNKRAIKNNNSIKEREQAWEKEFILEQLRKNRWNPEKVAGELGITRSQFKQKLVYHQIKLSKPSRKKETNQNTLQRSVVLCGQGLHSGIKTGLILSPLPPDSGIVFEDISTGETVKAHIDNVASTKYATTLKKNYTSVKTIEHIMAALHMYRISNLLIKIGDEVPIMDGSARDFCELIEDGGIEEQMINLEEIVIDKEYCVKNNGRSIRITPSNKFEVKYQFKSDGPIKEQKFVYSYRGKESFKNEIAPARTFGFLKEYEKLEEMGLASGGRLSNVILLDDEKVINTNLRFSDEFARHKILDIIGDFYLLGKPVRGCITACMTGHADNIALLKDIRNNLMA